MTQKHLVRHKLVGLGNEYEYDKMVESNRSLVDEFLSEHLPVHSLEITPDEMKNNGISPYERDNMTELGEALLVMPELLEKSESFQKLISEIGYKKPVVKVNNGFYDGGKFIICKDFGLVSYSIQLIKKIKKAVKLNVPTYRVSQVSTLFYPGIYHDYEDHVQLDLSANCHIDCRFNVLDEARIIYVAMGAKPGSMKEGPNPMKEESFKELQKAAKKHGYEIRDYTLEKEELLEKLNDPEFLEAEKKFGDDAISGYITNGINFITLGKKLFTSIIGYREKDYFAE